MEILHAKNIRFDIYGSPYMSKPTVWGFVWCDNHLCIRSHFDNPLGGNEGVSETMDSVLVETETINSTII